jgi:hypothetical protein
VPQPVSSCTATIEIGEPKRFKLGAVLVMTASGALLALPVLASVLVVSVLKLGTVTILLPALAVLGAILFLPVGRGNPYASWLVRSMHPAATKPDGAIIVQVTLTPRLRSGLCAILEDADDIGLLTVDGSGIQFQGDSVKLSVPYGCMKEIQPGLSRMRGPFLSGRRIGIAVTGLPNVSGLEFAERTSWLLPASSRITRQLHQKLLRR